MQPVLNRIKRLIIRRSYVFTEKALVERIADGLLEEDVIEAILNATFVRSKNLVVHGERENKKLYISLRVSRTMAS